jgi:arginine exporter protein ArgO
MDDDLAGCLLVTDALISGLLAGYGVAIPVGAIGVLIIGLSARTSLRVGVGAALGVATADGVYALIAVLGGAAIAAVIKPIATPLRVLAAIVLLAIAVRIGVTAWQHHRDPARAAETPRLTSAPRAYAALIGLTMLNPATVVYFAALVLGNRASGASGSVAEQTVFVLAAFVASASWQLLLAASGSALGRALGGPRGRLATALASSALIVVLAMLTLAN